MYFSKTFFIVYASASLLKTVSLEQNVRLFNAVTDTSTWPIPGLHSAMNGFDPVISDTLNCQNPGYKNKIFEPLTFHSRGRDVLNSFVVNAGSLVCCNGILKENIIPNYNSYKKLRQSDFTFSKDSDESVSSDLTKNTEKKCGLSNINSSAFNFQNESGYGRKDNNNEESIRKFFSQTQGEIIEYNSECIAYSVAISSYVKPVFTEAFTQALKILHTAAMIPNSKESNDSFIQFVQEFGTHYMKNTKLGSKIIFQKLFAYKSSDQEESKRRRDCVEKAAQRIILGQTLHNWHESFTDQAAKCDESRDQLKHLGINLENVIPIGAFLSNIKNWSTATKTDPVPISFELDKISHITRPEWLDEIFVPKDAIKIDNLNLSIVSSFLELKYSSYNQLMQGQDCPSPRTGCGYDSDCAAGTVCVPDESNAGNYTCAVGEWHTLAQ